MKKLTTVAAALVLCLSVAARAESARRSTAVSGSHEQKFLVGVDADFGLPIGSYADANGVGGGVLLTGEYPVIENLSATARIGFQYHLDKNIPALGADTHVHSIPVLLGAKYYVMPEKQGLFAAAELGMFDLMTGVSSGGASASQNDVKFGGGVGAGWAMKQWNVRVNLHSHDFGHFGDAIMITAGAGYQFAGF
jgi:hypothetical protein